MLPGKNGEEVLHELRESYLWRRILNKVLTESLITP